MRETEPERVMPINWVDAVVKIGLPAALTVFLVWRMTGTMETTLIQMAVDHRTSLSQHEKLMDDGVSLKVTLTQILLTLQATCANQAKDTSARELCFGVKR